MAGNDRNLLGGEAGTHQAAGLHFLVGEDGAEALHQAGMEVVEQTVDDGVQVTPYDKLLGRGFVVSLSILPLVHFAQKCKEKEDLLSQGELILKRG